MVVNEGVWEMKADWRKRYRPTDEEVIGVYLRQRSMARTARILDISHETVGRILHRNNVNVRRPGRPVSKTKRRTKVEERFLSLLVSVAINRAN